MLFLLIKLKENNFDFWRWNGFCIKYMLQISQNVIFYCFYKEKK